MGTKKLSKEKISQLKDSFLRYKKDSNLSTEKIAIEMGVNRTTIENYFGKFFQDEYSKIAKSKKLISRPLSQQTRLRISKSLKGKSKPPRSLQHRVNMSKSMSRSHIERFGEEKAKLIAKKIGKSNLGKKRKPRDEE